MTPALTTSFIIPHKGRLELLHQTVASIHAQTRYDWIESIVVVTMNTDPICFENDDKVIVLTIPDAPSISYQRNQGAAKSSASYLAFLDADIELAPEWLETCHRLLAERPVRHMVSAMQRCKHDDNPIERVRSALSNAALDVNVSFLPGRNLLLSRDDFFEAGAFPEHLKTCEDYYFTERVSARGELFYTSKTWYYHLGEDASYWETFSKERWRSEYNLLSVRGRSVPVAEWPSLLLPFWFVLSAVLGIIGLLIANEDITNIALLAAIAPLIVYSIRLYAKNTGTLRLWDIVKFYAAYFPGRALGTTIGIKKAISSIKDSKIQQIRCTQQSKNECKKSGTPLKRPLRVMEFICPTGYYGAERWVIALAKNMDRTHVLCELVVTHECAEPLEVSKQFEALGLPCHAIPLRNRFDLSAIYTLSQLLKKRQIDVLHTHGYKSDILGVIAAKYAGIPAVCTPHGFENAEDWKLRAYLWLGGLSFRFFNVLSPLSPQISHDLTKTYRIAPHRIHPILNGVDLSEVYQVRKTTLKKNSDRFIIGYIGQLISRKNLSDMLLAFAQFHETHNNTELHLVGDGEERAALEQQAHSLGIADHTRFLGFRDDRLMLLKQFDVFAMTSSLEGVPRCLMEAMAMGVPLSAFHIAGVDQLIEPELTGLSCPFGDTSGLARCWESLYRSPDLRESLVKNAAIKVANQFSAERMAREYAELFYRVCEKNTESKLKTVANQKKQTMSENTISNYTDSVSDRDGNPVVKDEKNKCQTSIPSVPTTSSENDSDLRIEQLEEHSTNKPFKTV